MTRWVMLGVVIGATAAIGPLDTASARSCYSIWAEADGSGSHYRHFVYVEQDYRPAYATTIRVEVSAVVRASGLVIEPSASGPGLSAGVATISVS